VTGFCPKSNAKSQKFLPVREVREPNENWKNTFLQIVCWSHSFDKLSAVVTMSSYINQTLTQTYYLLEILH